MNSGRLDPEGRLRVGEAVCEKLPQRCLRSLLTTIHLRLVELPFRDCVLTNTYPY